MGKFLLEMNHISKLFHGVRVLDDVTVQVRPGTVHAIAGQTGAGKSTLLKCLCGIYQEDAGEIILEEQPVHLTSSKLALDVGISVIHQELQSVSFRPVMETIWLGRYSMKWFAVDHQAMYEETKKLFAQVGLHLNPAVLAGTLSQYELQLVEIAKAISYHAKIFILDEPITNFSLSQKAHLFDLVQQLKSQGCSILYASNHLKDILQIADEITVLREGHNMGTWDIHEVTTEFLRYKMGTMKEIKSSSCKKKNKHHPAGKVPYFSKIKGQSLSTWMDTQKNDGDKPLTELGGMALGNRNLQLFSKQKS